MRIRVRCTFRTAKNTPYSLVQWLKFRHSHKGKETVSGESQYEQFQEIPDCMRMRYEFQFAVRFLCHSWCAFCIPSWCWSIPFMFVCNRTSAHTASIPLPNVCYPTRVYVMNMRFLRVRNSSNIKHIDTNRANRPRTSEAIVFSIRRTVTPLSALFERLLRYSDEKKKLNRFVWLC